MFAGGLGGGPLYGLQAKEDKQKAGRRRRGREKWQPNFLKIFISILFSEYCFVNTYMLTVASNWM